LLSKDFWDHIFQRQQKKIQIKN